jgi:hypothetical protein
MGFTSELEELRGDIFRRIATLSREQSAAPSVPENATDTAEPVLEGADKQLSEISPSVRIHQVVDRQDGPADIGDSPPHPRGTPRIRAGIDRYQGADGGIVATVAHQAAEAQAQIRSTRCRISSAIALLWSRYSPI